MSDLLRGLNPEQLAAVTLPPQHALILAGAGSGKTRVLTTRIAWLIQTGQATPAGILAVTFTNKAAREMTTRLSAMLPPGFQSAARGMWIGTFHGLCNRMLRAHHRDAALPQLFQILDSADQLSAVKRLLKNLNVDDEKFPARELQYFINAQKEAGLRAHQVDAWDDFTRRRVELYREYDAQCQREGVVDFAELLLRSYELLQRHEPICAHYRNRFRFILVDEFQDTNRLQYLWLKLLAGGGAHLFCVGDDDQSIYAFRGAEIGNMRDFEREFRVPNVIRLEQNYRSHGNILDAANAIIKHNVARLGKNLWTEAGAGEPLRLFEAPSDGEEARWIVEELKALAADGMARSQMAVLYRSNAQSRVLEHALFAAGMPYRVWGGLRFFERQEVKHALAYLRLIANPHDDTAFSRVVNFPPRGIGARSLELLQDTARAAGVSLFAAIRKLAGAPAAKLGAFESLILDLERGAGDIPLPELVDHVVDLAGLRAHYRSEREGQDRLANLDELVNAAANFIAEEEEPSLANFLAHASLEAGEHQAEQGAEAVQLMTVHSAKGLEFDAVFITGIEEGLFPHENSLSDADGVEEERRLMYVAITRARQRLYLSFSQTRLLHGQTRYNVKSRFFDELPEHCLKWLSPRQAGFGSGHVREYQNAWARGSGLGSIVGAGRVEPPFSAGPTPSSTGSGTGLRTGQSVFHAKFGEGVILTLEGRGADARAQINFGRHGLKWLALGIAKLTPID